MRTGLILSALGRLKAEDITPDMVRTALSDALALKDLPIEVITAEMESLTSKGILRKDSGKYAIVSLPKARDYDALLRTSIADMVEALKAEDKDFDPYDYRGIEKAVGDSIVNLTVAMTTAIRERDQPGWALGSEGLKSALLSPWKEGSAKLAQVGDLFLRYLQSDAMSAKALLASVYETCLTLDMLSRGARFEEALKEAPPPDRVFLDTNCLSALLCSSNRYHDAVAASLRLSRRFGFQMGYIGRTRLELSQLLQAATRSIKEGDVVDAARRNEFVYDFSKRFADKKWSDRLTELEMWPQWLNDEFGIIEYEAAEPLEKTEKEQEFETVYKIFLSGQREYREPAAIAHDACLYGLVQTRKETVTGLFDSPLVETLDRYFWQTNSLLNKVKGYPSTVVHATHWLNTLAQFVDAKVDDKDIVGVAQGVLKNLLQTSSPGLSIAEYTRLLAARYDWEPKQALLIAQVLTESVYRSELERALEESNADAAAVATQRILDDGKLIEAVVGRSKAEAEAADLRSRMQAMSQEITASRKVIHYLREAATRPVVVEVHVANVPDQAIFLMERLLDEIETRMAERARADGIDKSILGASDKAGFRRAVEKVEGFLRRAAADVVAAQTLLPIISEVLRLIGHP